MFPISTLLSPALACLKYSRVSCQNITSKASTLLLDLNIRPNMLKALEERIDLMYARLALNLQCKREWPKLFIPLPPLPYCRVCRCVLLCLLPMSCSVLLNKLSGGQQGGPVGKGACFQGAGFPRIHMTEGKNSQKLSSDFQICVSPTTTPYTRIII